MNPIISIIVPVYNVEKYLDRCIESIICQTFKDFELILIDDGSPDKCGDMCDEWLKKDTRIKVVHKKNGGLSSARNEGLKIAEGTYVAFVDSDDTVHKQMFEHLYEMIKDHPDAQISQCDYQIINNNNISFSQPSLEIKVFDKDAMFNYFFRTKGERSNTGVCTKLISKNLLKSFRFLDTLNEDVEASYEFYSLADKMVSSNQKYYYYYVNKKGITNSGFSLKDLDYLKVWDNIILRTKEEHPEFLKFALLGRKRANFTLLSKMLLKGYDKTNNEIKFVKKKMKKELKLDFCNLIMHKMPISRKILLIIVCIV